MQANRNRMCESYNTLAKTYKVVEEKNSTFTLN